tara:strand:- start:935 stop:1240 length:306 start_codon:yes stop_codon:yes gene_type:complete
MKEYLEYKTHRDYRQENCVYTGSKITFPYSIIIRTQLDGMIWQIYNIKNHTDRVHEDAIILNAYNKGYEDIRILKDTKYIDEETYPKWRQEVRQFKYLGKK